MVKPGAFLIVNVLHSGGFGPYTRLLTPDRGKQSSLFCPFVSNKEDVYCDCGHCILICCLESKFEQGLFANNGRECFGHFNSSLFEFLTFNQQIFGTFINLWRLAGVAGLEPSTLGG